MRSKSKRNPPPAAASTDPDYAFTLTRTAIAQICKSIGFTAAEAPALRTLSDIATRYLRSIAKSAADSANSACRTQSNLVDTIAAVEELSSVSGFPGAWKSTGNLLNSGAVKQLASFSEYSEEIPFAKPLPRKIFLKYSEESLTNVSSSNNEYIGGERKHIPKWLPVMPVIEKEEDIVGNELWGFCGKTEEKEERGEKKEEENERKGMELPLKRGGGKVRFRIGNSGGGGGVLGAMCRRRGGGIGKRVLCENWIFDDDDDENHQKQELDEVIERNKMR